MYPLGCNQVSPLNRTIFPSSTLRRYQFTKFSTLSQYACVCVRHLKATVCLCIRNLLQQLYFAYVSNEMSTATSWWQTLIRNAESSRWVGASTTQLSHQKVTTNICHYENTARVFSGEFTKLWKATIRFVMPIRPSVCLSTRKNSAPIGRISIKFDIWATFGNLSWTLMLDYNLTITGTLHEDVSTFTISCWTHLKMRNAADKSCTKIETRILCSGTLFRKSCRLWDSVEKYGVRQATDHNTAHALCTHARTQSM